MKSRTKKLAKFFTCLFLTLAIVLSTSVSVFAIEQNNTRAGTETWSSTTNTYVGSMHFTNTNLTPVKTIGRTGTLTIWGHFYGEDDYAAYKPINFTAQLKRAYGSVLTQTVVYDDRSGLIHFQLQYPVKAGDQLQLYFTATTASGELPGYTRAAFAEYWYCIS